MIEIAVGEQDAGDGGLPAGAGPQRGEALDLGADLGRDVDQEPGIAVGADRHRLLRARARAGGPAARRLAVVTPAVPLRETTTCRRSENANLHSINRFPL